MLRNGVGPVLPVGSVQSVKLRAQYAAAQRPQRVAPGPTGQLLEEACHLVWTRKYLRIAGPELITKIGLLPSAGLIPDGALMKPCARLRRRRKLMRRNFPE